MQVPGVMTYPGRCTRRWFWGSYARTRSPWVPPSSSLMKTLQFHTNINCGSCIKAVTPTLNDEKARVRPNHQNP